jgi:hypothetical protein
MRDQVRDIRYAAFAAAAMLLSLASIPAQAQGVPGGSYLQSCTNVRMFGDRVVAECRRADGSWDRTSLNVSRCIGGLANANGQLTCGYGEPGFGSSHEGRYYGYPRYFGYGR